MVNNRPSKRGKRNGLKVAFVNIVSLRKRKHELEVILRENDIDIYCEGNNSPFILFGLVPLRDVVTSFSYPDFWQCLCIGS